VSPSSDACGLHDQKIGLADDGACETSLHAARTQFYLRFTRRLLSEHWPDRRAAWNLYSNEIATMTMPHMYEMPEPWEKSVPSDLVPAAKHIHDSFKEADWKCRMVTEHLCYAMLHPEQVDDDLFREHTSALAYLKKIVGSSNTQMFHDLLKRETPSAVLKAFFHLYEAAMAVHVKGCFHMLLEIGLAHEKRLGTPAIDWASWHIKNMIRQEAFTTDIWLKHCCDKQVYDPEASTEDQIWWTSWRVPEFVLMQPSLGMPYDKSRSWERRDEETTLSVLKRFHEYFVLHLENVLKNSVGEAHLRVAKEGPKPQPAPEKRDATNARREARKLDTQAKYKSWQKEYRRLKKDRPGMSDVWYSQKIASMDVAKDSSPDTIRRHMK